MRAFVAWLRRLLWLVVVTALLGIGAIVALGRFYAPLVERHTDDIIAMVNERTGLQFEARSMRAEWRRFAPRIELEGLALRDPATGEAVVSIEQLRFRIDLVGTLRQLTPVLSGIVGHGLHVVLEEAPLGRWQLRGLPATEARGGGELVDLLLAIHSARLGDSRLELRFFNGGRTVLRGAGRAERAGNFRRLLLAMTTAGDGAPVELTLEARGDPRDSDRFQAHGFAHFNGVDLTPVLPLARNLGVDLRHGRIDGRAWLTWARGGSFTVRGELGIPKIDLAALAGRAVPPISNLQAQFVMREQPGERQLWLPLVTAEWGETPVRLERLWLAQRGAEPHQLELALPALDVAEVARWLALSEAGAEGLLPPAWQQALAGLAPSGELQAVRATLPLSVAQRDQFQMRARLAGVAVQPWRGAPGIAGATGYAEVDAQGGRVWLATPELALDFPGIYAEPIVLAGAGGRVDWRFTAANEPDGRRVRVKSGVLNARLADSQARARFTLDLPLRGDAAVPPQMQLSVGMRNGSPAVADQLIPQAVGPQLLAWLEAARLAGSVPQAGFLYRGSLRPRDHQARTVQLFLDIRDGALAFHPEWPALEGIAGQLWLDDATVMATATQARLYDSLELSGVEVALQPAARGSRLTASATAGGSGDDWLRLLRETPLSDQVGALVERLVWEGPASARVALAVPLGGAANDSPAVTIEGALEGGALRFVEPALAVEQLAGAFSFRQGAALGAEPPPPGLTAPALTGLLHGRPLQVAVATAADGAIDATVDTTLAIRDWRSWFPGGAPWLQGTARARGKFRWHERRASLAVHSNLVGLSLDLPPPYRKAPEAQLPFTLRLRNIAPTTELDARALNAQARGSRWAERRAIARTRLEAELDDWLHVALDWNGQQLRRGLVRFGPEAADAAQARLGALLITGELAAIDVAAWREPLQDAWQSGSQGAAASGGGELDIVIAGLRTSAVTLGGYRLDDVRLDGSRLFDRWLLQATSAQASGELSLPRGDARPPRLQLAELRLPAPAELSTGREREDVLAGIDPATLPALDFHVARLFIGADEWGSLGFELRPQANGAVFSALQGELRGLRLGARPDEPGRLIWTRLGDAHRTSLDARVGAGNIGHVMERFGFERAIVSRRGHFDLALGWPGSPAAIDLLALDGAAALSLRDGRFLRAPGGTTGALKVVGIFNLANLVRRLRLDFSDFFSDGISFDEIDGSFTLAEGRVRTVRPLEVTSPSSRFRLGGTLDLNSDAVDMELVVTLPLASNLPWVAAVAGGLPAAAGVYIASKLFGERVDRYSSAVYQVEGSWQEPSIRFRRIFDETPQAAPAAADATGNGERPGATKEEAAP